MTAMKDPDWDYFYRLMFDGGIKGGNPGGVMNYGWVLYDESDNVVAQGKWSGADPDYPETTNNIAEYLGLRAGLKWIEVNFETLMVERKRPLIVNGDSQLIINQVAGMWSARKPHLRKLRTDCMVSLSNIPVEHWIYWVPREANQSADALGREANGERQ